MTRQPTPEERDERVTLPLDPDEALRALMETGAHPQDDDQAGGVQASKRPDAEPSASSSQ